MFGANPRFKFPKIVTKFLDNSEENIDVKTICFRMTSHKDIQEFFENSPMSAVYLICEEHQKHPDLYDGIFDDRIQFYRKDFSKQFRHSVRRENIVEVDSLRLLLENETLARQVVEKFGNFKKELGDVKDNECIQPES